MEKIVEQHEALAHHTNKQKEHLIATIGTRLWLGLDDLMRTIGVTGNNKTKTNHKHQIDQDLEKYEGKIINKRK